MHSGKFSAVDELSKWEMPGRTSILERTGGRTWRTNHAVKMAVLLPACQVWWMSPLMAIFSVEGKKAQFNNDLYVVSNQMGACNLRLLFYCFSAWRQNWVRSRCNKRRKKSMTWIWGIQINCVHNIFIWLIAIWKHLGQDYCLYFFSGFPLASMIVV